MTHYTYLSAAAVAKLFALPAKREPSDAFGHSRVGGVAVRKPHTRSAGLCREAWDAGFVAYPYANSIFSSQDGVRSGPYWTCYTVRRREPADIEMPYKHSAHLRDTAGRVIEYPIRGYRTDVPDAYDWEIQSSGGTFIYPDPDNNHNCVEIGYLGRYDPKNTPTMLRQAITNHIHSTSTSTSTSKEIS